MSAAKSGKNKRKKAAGQPLQHVQIANLAHKLDSGRHNVLRVSQVRHEGLTPYGLHSLLVVALGRQSQAVPLLEAPDVMAKRCQLCFLTVM